MKASELIKTMQALDPDANVCALWWTQEQFDFHPIRDDIWERICTDFHKWDAAGDEVGQWIHGQVIEAMIGEVE